MNSGSFKKKPPLYVLHHGIEVIGEYPASGVNRYWRVRVRPHPFFSGKVKAGGIGVRRSRAVMSSVVGRALLPSEHVHHKNENRNDDSLENLEILTAADHNREHKTGTKHTETSRQKTSASMKKAYTQELRQAKKLQAKTRCRDAEGKFI